LRLPRVILGVSPALANFLDKAACDSHQSRNVLIGRFACTTEAHSNTCNDNRLRAHPNPKKPEARGYNHFYEISYPRLIDVRLARLERRHVVDGPIDEVQGDRPDPLLRSCILHTRKFS